MRGGSLGGGLRLAALAASSLGVAAASAASSARGMGSALLGLDALPGRREHHYGRTRYPSGYSRGHSIADQPHEHKREIARRKRQAERNAEKRLARAVAASRKGRPMTPAGFGLSRSGRVIAL